MANSNNLENQTVVIDGCSYRLLSNESHLDLRNFLLNEQSNIAYRIDGYGDLRRVFKSTIGREAEK